MLVLEFAVRPAPLVPVDIAPPAVYNWLNAQPMGPVAEFPMPQLPREPQYVEGVFEYESTFHWRPIVNGYSGSTPDSFVRLLYSVAHFPDDESIAALRATGVAYVIVHQRFMSPDVYADDVARLDRRDDLVAAGPFPDGTFEVRAYRLKPSTK